MIVTVLPGRMFGDTSNRFTLQKLEIGWKNIFEMCDIFHIPIIRFRCMMMKKVSDMKQAKPIRVAMVAPPWLAMPIKGYGGIELVAQELIEEFKKQDNVEIVLYANGARKIKGVTTRSLYKEELLGTIDLPYYDAPLQIMQAHLHFALNDIVADGKFDIIHDHNPYIGPSFFALASRIKDVPPVLHTLHGPPFSDSKHIDEGHADNRPQFEQFNLG